MLKVAVLVSGGGTNLQAILDAIDEGKIRNARIVSVISNNPNAYALERAKKHGVPAVCITRKACGSTEAFNAALLKALKDCGAELIVLAGCLVVIPKEIIHAYEGRIINIHHAFLPAFQGGNPYQRAWERGVKMIGATAHYATPALDEGPIIEQDVERITHEAEPDDLKRIGKDIERRVLTRAVRAHLEHRIITSGRRTIVFSR